MDNLDGTSAHLICAHRLHEGETGYIAPQHLNAFGVKHTALVSKQPTFRHTVRVKRVGEELVVLERQPEFEVGTTRRIVKPDISQKESDLGSKLIYTLAFLFGSVPLFVYSIPSLPFHLILVCILLSALLGWVVAGIVSKT